jgi:hypothetical protein
VREIESERERERMCVCSVCEPEWDITGECKSNRQMKKKIERR